jgi:integrase
MASLQARHSRTCALDKPWTPFELPADCTCTPTYYVAFRDEGKLVREKVGRNRRTAERARDKLAVAVDEGTYQALPEITFRDWGRRWLDSLERKASTKTSYESTIAYATEVFGHKTVRRLGPGDVSAFNAKLREIVVAEVVVDGKKEKRLLSDSSRAKHLRVLNACLSSAVSHGYAGRNVVRDLPKAERPRPAKRESAYFTDGELPVLLSALEPGVYRTLFEVALKTGMRVGELTALEWGDIDFTDAVIHVRRSVRASRVSLPKNHERRAVDVTPDVIELLGEWWGEVGRPGDEVIVFPGETPSGYLDSTTILRRELYPAMERAGVPREGPTGEKRTFHSFRHTFARLALENGAELTWLSRHLGHSSTAVTDTVYGHWGRAARKRQVERLADAFAELYAQTYAQT